MKKIKIKANNKEKPNKKETKQKKNHQRKTTKRMKPTLTAAAAKQGSIAFAIKTTSTEDVDNAFTPPISQWDTETCLSFLSPSDTRQRKLCGTLRLADVKEAVIDRLKILTHLHNSNSITAAPTTISTTTNVSQNDIRMMFQIITTQHQLLCEYNSNWHLVPNITSSQPEIFIKQAKLMHKHLVELASQLSAKKDTSNINVVIKEESVSAEPVSPELPSTELPSEEVVVEKGVVISVNPKGDEEEGDINEKVV